MDSISELLSSVSPEELERLKGVAQSLIAQNGTEQEKRETPPQKPQENSGIGSLFSADTAKMLATVAGQMNREDDRTKFIAALKPLLSEDRRKKADEAMRFLRLMDTLPLLKGLF
ncbi:MAG: hypothetical protein K1V97_09080 [Lachnospiraceae bacterium]